MRKYKLLGELLLEKGFLTPAQIQNVFTAQKSTTKRFGQIVRELGYATEDNVAICIAEQFDLRYSNANSLYPTSEALSLVPEKFAREQQILPLQLNGDRLLCAISDPLDVETTDSLSASLKCGLDFIVTSSTGLLSAIERSYFGLPLAPKKVRVAKHVRKQRDRIAIMKLYEKNMLKFDKEITKSNRKSA